MSTPPPFPAKHVVGLLLAAALGVAACNPFAPAKEEGDPFNTLQGDPTTIEGFFANFKNAYELRDISLYEPLLDSTFTFVYFDFDAQVERRWGFAQELASTRSLFQSADLIQLRWNQIIMQSEAPDGEQARVVRSFNLLISLAEGEDFRGSGNVNFRLVRSDSTDTWKLARWRDESEF
jgi:hypothetical protein